MIFIQISLLPVVPPVIGVLSQELSLVRRSIRVLALRWA